MAQPKPTTDPSSNRSALGNHSDEDDATAPGNFEAMSAMLVKLRAEQVEWQLRDLGERLRIVGRVAPLIAEQAERLASAIVSPVASKGEVLASQVLPLAEACRYVARRGRQVLGPRVLPRRDAAWWMGSIKVIETRQPFGVVLIIGPANYPLLLPGVQMIQALAASNAVVVKPAPGGLQVLKIFIELCIEAGVPPELVQLLPTTPSAAQLAVRARVDKVVFTGSYETGRAVARELAESVTPALLELSGCDAVFVLEDADLERVAKSVVYALTLNGGQTCIAPRRLFATANTLEQLEPLLQRAIASIEPRSIESQSSEPRALEHATELVEQAVDSGARLACGQIENWKKRPVASIEPVVLTDVRSTMRVACEDIFAPLLSLIEVRDMSAALEQSRMCRYALGAAVYGSDIGAMRFAARVTAGCVTVNDVLIPTADPRVSFGGWHDSGYGVTRGLEGLREMARLKVTCQRRGRWLPHLSTPPAKLELLMRGLLLLRHGHSTAQRWSGLKCLLNAVRK